MAAIPMVYVFAGEDTFSSTQKVIAWKKRFEEKYGLANLQTIDCASAADETDIILQISRALRGGTLFSPVTLTILRGLWGQKSRAPIRDKVEELIRDLPSQAFVIIHDEKMDGRTSLCQTLKKLAKENKASVEEFSIPRREALSAWIASHVKKLGALIEQGAVRELSSRFDPEVTSFQQETATPFNLWEVNMEIQKVIAYAHGRTITATDIRMLTPYRTDAHIFDLTDALFRRDTISARVTLQHLIAEERDPRGFLIGVVSFLETQFRDALVLALLSESGISGNAIAEQLAWNPKRVWVVQKKLSSHTGDSLAKTYHRLLVSEMDLKTKASPLALMDLAMKGL